MTCNTLPATQYKDPKKYLWLLSVIAPFAAPLGPIMYLYTGHTQWLWVFLAFFYLGLPVLDFVFGEDKQNPPEQAVPQLENTTYYRVITYLRFGLNLGHEMGHKKRKLDKALALFTLSLGGYGHFSIEHNRGHHRDVATPEDPATSRMGEHIYEFMLREIPGAFKRAWKLEGERLERAGKSRWNMGNEILQAGAMTVVLYTTLIAMFGWSMVPVMAVVAFWGAFQLTSANYIEHYGLMRQKLPSGEYERCAPHHSWNSNHLVSNLVVFQLQRHSDHHANPARSYQSLRDFPELPSLPSGYFGMFLIAYVPPLWFAIMNPRLLEVAGKNAQKINIHPRKRARVIQRYSLAA